MPAIEASLGPIARTEVVITEAAVREGYALRELPRKDWQSANRIFRESIPEAQIALLEPLWKSAEQPIAREAVRQWLLRAIEQAGDFARIDEILAEAPIVKTRDGADTHMRAARILVRSGRVDEARDHLRQGLAIVETYREMAAPFGIPPLVWRQGLENAQMRQVLALAELEAGIGNAERSEALFELLLRKEDSGSMRLYFADTLVERDPARAAEEYVRALARAEKDEPRFLEPIEKMEKQLGLSGLVAKAHAERRPARVNLARQRRVEEPPPALFARHLDGKRLFDAAALRGPHASIITFFETTCGPCLAEHRALDKLKRLYRDRLRVFVVSFDSPKTLDEYLREKRIDGFEYFRAVDEKQTRKDFDVVGVPVSLILLDENVAYRHDGFGPQMEEQLSLELEALLGPPE